MNGGLTLYCGVFEVYMYSYYRQFYIVQTSIIEDSLKPRDCHRTETMDTRWAAQRLRKYVVIGCFLPTISMMSETVGTTVPITKNKKKDFHKSYGKSILKTHIITNQAKFDKQ